MYLMMTYSLYIDNIQMQLPCGKLCNYASNLRADDSTKAAVCMVQRHVEMSRYSVFQSQLWVNSFHTPLWARLEAEQQVAVYSTGCNSM